MASDVRIGVVGIGNIGSAHAVNIFDGAVQGLRLGAVCDIASEKRAWAAARLPNVPVFEEYAEMLKSERIDAVLIATPHYLHPDMAVAAFSRGLHVLTEKPAGVYTNQVVRMNEAAARAGRVFGIMFNQRTDPLFRRVRELVQGGFLGESKRFLWVVTNWYRTQAYYDSGGWRATWDGEGGGVLLNQAPHHLDLWQWIFGMPARVRAFCGYGRYHRIEVEDDATIYGEYDSGAVATFITTTGEYPGTNRLEIRGDRGKLVAEDGRLRLWELDASERVTCFDEAARLPNIVYREERPTEQGTGHNGILQNFTNAIRMGEPLIAPGEEGLRSLTIANAAYLSDWTGETVTLPPDGDHFEELLRVRAAQPHKRAEANGDGVPAGTYHPRWSVRW